MQIDWDPVKAAANLQAHGVSLGEAATVLEDDSMTRWWRLSSSVQWSTQCAR